MQDLRRVQVRDLIKVQDTSLILEVDTQRALPEWLELNRLDVARLLAESGALLIRGLKIPGSRNFADTLTSLFGQDLLEYNYRSTPRTGLKGGVYTATEYHAAETIPQHNENSYAHCWPLRLGFLCVVPPRAGGRTPIADSRVVYRKIPEPIRSRFERKSIMYVRNYGDIDLPWSEVFQTADKRQVEAYCRSNDIAFDWVDDTRLQTRQISQASAVHPTSHEKVWFNQAHLFHVSSMEEERRRQVMAALGGNPPRNARYGDGSSIEESDLDHIRAVYDDSLISFTWQANDLLLLDNMLFSHGREAYEGSRKLLCGMAGACSASPTHS
jgi:alpha-ketoglutarate-dependent taurine dioxygenase